MTDPATRKQKQVLVYFVLKLEDKERFGGEAVTTRAFARCLLQ